MKFNTDTPISGDKHSEDLLGRGQFCSRIAEQLHISPGDPGFVLSIEGPWGFGKTSALNLIARHLTNVSNDVQPIVIHFNPWMVGSLESLAKEFFLQFSSAAGLSRHAEMAKNLSKSLESYSQLISFAKWIPGAEPWSSIISNSLGIGGKSAEAIADSSALNIAKQKRRVENALIELKQSFVVFIDDLDRLPPEEVSAMIRLVKAMSDFPQVAYVLAFDPLYVAAALEKSGISGGDAYLDKIVQIRVPLPRIGLAQIARLVEQESASFEIDEDTQVFPNDKERLNIVYHRCVKHLLRTPRDVYRVFNRLRLLYPEVKMELGLADLFGLETIAITAPPLYNHICSRPQAYVGLSEERIVFEKPREVVESLKQEREDALGQCPSVLRAWLVELVGILFPLTVLTFGDEWPPRISGHVANVENLLIALSRGLPSTRVSLEQIRIFVENPIERERITSEVSSYEKLEDFLDLLNTALAGKSFHSLKGIQDPEGLVDILADLAERDAARTLRKRFDFFKATPSTQICWILYEVLTKMPSDKARELIRRTLESAEKMAISVSLLQYLRWQQGLYDEDAKQPESSWLVTAEDLEALAEEWVRSTKRALISGVGWSSTEITPALALVKTISPCEFREIVEERLGSQSPEAIDDLARAIGTGCWNSSKGEYANFDDNRLRDFGDVERLKQVATERLSDVNLLDPGLRAIYTSIINGTKEYFCDHEVRS